MQLLDFDFGLHWLHLGLFLAMRTKELTGFTKKHLEEKNVNIPHACAVLRPQNEAYFTAT